MKSLIAFTFILTTSIATFADDGWIELFDGQSLRGWHAVAGKHTFKVEDGMILGSPVEGEGNGFLRTDEVYGDFILEFDAWWEAPLNSGVQIRSIQNVSGGKERVQGYQIELDPSERAWSGGIIDESRHGWLYSLSSNPKARGAYKAGTWNHFRIEAIGDVVKTWINDMPAANLMVDFNDEGFIALQVNGIKTPQDAGKYNHWKNIRIKTAGLETESTQMSNEIEQFNFIANTLTKRQIDEGWRLLWDGKTTKGWRSIAHEGFPKKGWDIKDGILSTQDSGDPHERNGGDIFTEEEFSSFELELDYRISKGANSGIKYFVDPELLRSDNMAIGLEFQILDDKDSPEALKEGHDDRIKMGALYRLIKPVNMSESGRLNKRVNSAGKWNRARIVVRGNHVEHWLNNSKVISYERGSEDFRARVADSKYDGWPNFGEHKQGPILLQDHGDKVEFRSIKIRELEPEDRK